jgi:hypothetical protein
MSEAKARYELEITGTIQIKLSYIIESSTLDIFIKKCTNLAQNKRHQSSNPYVSSSINDNLFLKHFYLDIVKVISYPIDPREVNVKPVLEKMLLIQSSMKHYVYVLFISIDD